MSRNFYRLRSAERALDELEEQIIYFAPPEKLNDPMEGYRNIYWDGDAIVWKNLFRHYLLCLERIVALIFIVGNEYEISEANIPVFSSELDLPTEMCKETFDKIKARFFSVESVKNLIEIISERESPVYRNELICHLRDIHLLILKIIFDVFCEEGLSPEANKLKDEIIDGHNLTYFKELNELIEQKHGDSADKGKAIDVTFGIMNKIDQEFRLILKYNNRSKRQKNKDVLFFDFPCLYVKAIEKLVFPGWYTACFLSDFGNSSVWGHYGDNHSGVCLIFKSESDNGQESIRLGSINGCRKSEPLYSYSNHQFYEIDYIEGHGTIDFFRSFGPLSRETLYEMWYYDEDGNVSSCYKDVFEDEKSWRSEHWQMFFRDITKKSKDWAYEHEFRLILTDFKGGVSGQTDGNILKYDFSSLAGLIFGINTKEEDKLKIIEVIEGKCRQSKRTDFEFYQAYYDPGESCIKHSKFGLLKFKQ